MNIIAALFIVGIEFWLFYKYIYGIKYAYEMEFMPRMLAPIKISTNEIEQDFVGETEDDN